MDINDVIADLMDYCYSDDSKVKIERDLIDNYQEEFLNGFISILLNKYLKEDGFEVYLCIKSKRKIACPLLYKFFKDKKDAKKYYKSLKKIIFTFDEKNIINCCKTRAKKENSPL